MRPRLKVLIFASIIQLVFSSPSFSRMVVHVLDVGYGSAVHVEVDYNHYLFDTGPEPASQDLLRHFSSRFTTRLNGIFLTHTHQDHMGALGKLLDQYKVDFVFWNEEFPPDEDLVEILDKANIRTELKKFSPGKSMQLGNELMLSVLNNRLTDGDMNDNSLVYVLTYKKKNVLMIPGDIGKRRQLTLVPEYKKLLKNVRWFLWPHHGDELVPEFMNSFKKLKTCVVSVGKNDYGLPANSIMDQANTMCREFYTTTDHGTVSFLVGRRKLEAVKIRPRQGS